MKKFLVAVLAVIMSCVLPVVSVCADTFVPSIGYKPAPDIDDDRDGCIIVTSVAEAETTTLIPREVADDLIDKYNRFAAEGFNLSDISEELNKLVKDTLGEGHDADSLVIRDFFNVFSLCADLDAYLEVDGQAITLTFDIDFDGKEPFVIVNVPGTDEWNAVEVKDNGDGTASILFEDFGHVAVMVPSDDAVITPPTGDTSADNTLWVALMIGASLLIVAFVGANIHYYRRRKFN